MPDPDVPPWQCRRQRAQKPHVDANRSPYTRPWCPNPDRHLCNVFNRTIWMEHVHDLVVRCRLTLVVGETFTSDEHEELFLVHWLAISHNTSLRRRHTLTTFLRTFLARALSASMSSCVSSSLSFCSRYQTSSSSSSTPSCVSS